MVIGNRPLTQNFWVVVKFGSPEILGQKTWVKKKFWVNVFGSLQKFGSEKNSGSKN